ncbi:MAG TPA: DHA2 family efflux MFS transporter permease subunit [Phenylobacterium sp.]|jgi:DHA2 family multidrug resistance protein|uniref:DHA2 family efflux MFS transporter permease subunit n=1 Tax=Phenylobacterium sp. TaxID=1871053 RepID=UPI002C75C00C|nr:DHA2 family efflux MFS transporter permease subunit [Phenylobacterium sp.]HXA38918.1 DHA2 family efflux MFS transporter permease subunit [Phenylobacterium sp.]
MADDAQSAKATAAAGAPAMPAPMTGSLLAITSIALALGTFMQVLDSTIANVSIPTISGNLGVSTSQGTWVITSFAVANGVSVPLTAWLMMRYGVVKTFVSSVVLFTIASFLCGVSWNLPSLILFRVLQGAVSGPMIPGSQALLIMIFPAAQRGTALAIWSMTTLVAPICGPILGGYISDNISWPWIFLINVPVGIVCTVICWRNMISRETPTRVVPIDRTGFFLLLTWVGALQVMLDTGKDADWFNSPAIVVETIVAAIGFVAWLIWELNEQNPIVDLSLMKSRNFVIATIVSCLGFAMFFGANLLSPLWLQTRMGYIATWAGLVAAPSGVVAVFLTPFAARLMNRVDARWTASLSLVAFALSFFMRSRFTTDIGFIALVMPSLVQGVAMSTFFVSMVTLTLNGVPGQQVPQASGLYNFARITAGSFAASLVSTVWEQTATLHQNRLSEVMGAQDPAFVGAVGKLQSLGLSGQQALGAVTNQVVNQAYLLATDDIFRICSGLMVLLIPCVWLTKKALGAGAAHAAAD